MLTHIPTGLVVASVVVGLFLSLVFARQAGAGNRARGVLALLLATFSISAALNAYLAGVIPTHYPGVRAFPDPFLLLIGPLFYAYVLTLSGQAIPRRNLLIHALPFAASLALFLWLMGRDASGVWMLTAAVWLGIYVHLWIYYGVNRRALARYRTGLLSTRSSIEKLHEGWVAFCLALLLVCYTLLGLAFVLGHGGVFVPINRVLSIVFAGIILGMGYRALTRPRLFAALAGAAIQLEPTPPITKYRKSGLAGDAIVKQRQALEHFMISERPYLDPDLDLPGLAEMLQMSPHHLSQVINEGAASSFYEFVNAYRLEEAVSLLADPAKDHLSVLGIAFDAGFTSKATFNRFFRKARQQTPSQYRKARLG